MQHVHALLPIHKTNADLITAAILDLRPDRPYTIISVSINHQTVTLHFVGDAEHTVWKASQSTHPTTDKPSKRKRRGAS